MSLIPSVCLSLAVLLAMERPVSKEELRFLYVMEQGRDASCGMAAVATALSLYWHVPAREDELLLGLVPLQQSSGGRSVGTVSLASMATAFEQRGISARAYRLDWNGLKEALVRGYGPILVHYDRPDPHFALLLGVFGGVAVLADPARGLETLDRPVFERRYSGVALALASRELRIDTRVLDAAIRVAKARRGLMERAAARAWMVRNRSGW